MRYSPDRYFLHPVLGLHEHNYPNHRFSVDLQQTANRDTEIAMSAQFLLDVAYIKKLVNEGCAICTVVVYCSASSYRRAFLPGDDNFCVDILLDISEFRGKVEFNPQIVLARPAQLDTSEAASEFQNMIISLASGNPLAMHQPFEMQINDEDDNTKSIFQFEEDPTLAEGEWDLAIDHKERYLKIRFNPITKRLFELIRGAEPERTVETLYLSALTNVLDDHKIFDYSWDEDTLESDDKLWWHVLRSKIARMGVSLNGQDDKPMWIHDTNNGTSYRSSMWVAQKLLENPLNFVETKGVSDE